MCILNSMLTADHSSRRRVRVAMKSTAATAMRYVSSPELIIPTGNIDDFNGNLVHNLSDSSSCHGRVQVMMKCLDDPETRKVRFADTEGRNLVEVRELPVNSQDTPPDLSAALQIAGYASYTSPSLTDSNTTFTINFQQPVSDFLSFMDRIEKNKVCLESAVVVDSKLVGTIKVRNLAYHKTVFVRLTYDNWRSHVNIEAPYVNNAVDAGAAASAIDTFSFTYNTSPSLSFNATSSIEFAVCFRCQGSEYWDNNNGSNYRISVSNKEISNSTTTTSSDPLSMNHTMNKSPCLDEANINWSEYAVWNHLADDKSPYW